ncbi:hypothetical protein [Streptacidiphilus sp. PAMC 29251]
MARPRTAVVVAACVLGAALTVSGDVYAAHTVHSHQHPPVSVLRTDGAADEISADLRQDLATGFYSPGDTFGGPFTEGTLVNQAEQRGGVLLSLSAAGGQNQAELMLGLDQPGPGDQDVNCYRVSFGVGSWSVAWEHAACPADQGTVDRALSLYRGRVDTAATSQRPNDFPATPVGAEQLLRAQFAALPGAASAPELQPATTSADGVLAGAVRVDGICDYLRLAPSATISSLVEVWPAPLDDQADCAATQALAASGLYGSDPAAEG